VSAMFSLAGLRSPWSAPAGPAGSPAEQEARASLRSLRGLLLLCLLVPALLFVAFAAYRFQQVQREAEVRLDRALRIAHEHALKVLETSDTLLAHVTDIAPAAGVGIEGSANLQEQLATLARFKPQVVSIRITDAQGQALVTDRERASGVVNVSDRSYFRWHQGRAPDGEIYFSEVLVGRVSNKPFFDMSKARSGVAGAFAGVVSVSVSPEYFTRFHADLSANEPGLAITMFRQDGTVYSRWPALASAPPRMAASSPVLARVLAGETRGVIRGVSSLDRNDRLIMFQRVGTYPVYLGTGLEMSAIRAAWLREMATLGAFSAIPVLGLVIAALAAMKRGRQSLEAARRLREEGEARLQVEEALRQAQKMEALGRLTGGVAHDFNNALMVISANLHVLKLTQPQAAGKQTEAIARAVDTAANLTRQLLAFSRRQALTPQVLQLQRQLPQMKDLLAPVLGSQVPLTIDVEADAPAIKVDVAELELALINLAVNAKDAMPAGGSFRVTARRAPAPPPMTGEAALIEATDTGTGIPADLQARVFEPFFTTKPVGEGTGLGLSQVYGLCERSGGLAQIRSTPGAGTTVSLYFPAWHGAVEADSPEQPAAPATVDLRVLLVEDNADVAAAIRPVLEMLGCRVTHFLRARPAADWLDAHPREVDAVLTDVVMPGDMDGLALAQHVRRHHAALRLVVMTGYAEHMEEIHRQGFMLLAKPWTADKLARALRASAGTAAA
jgi:signal transduction histidine kinase/ActR/RegA family two-component response regulator